MINQKNSRSICLPFALDSQEKYYDLGVAMDIVPVAGSAGRQDLVYLASVWLAGCC